MDGQDGTTQPLVLTVRKWDVLDALRREHQLDSLVQFLTPSTGPDMLGRPELQLFPRVTTLQYATDQQRAERHESAGLPSLHSLLERLTRHPVVADVVFIDAWHSYEHSRLLLDAARKLLGNGGFIVIHDCDPPSRRSASSAPPDTFSMWCGETWRAFVDVTDALPFGAEWFVVESDLGVGVITVPAPSALRRRRNPLGTTRREMASRVPEGDDAAWSWFLAHRVEVLRPMPVEQWQERYA